MRNTLSLEMTDLLTSGVSVQSRKGAGFRPVGRAGRVRHGEKDKSKCAEVRGDHSGNKETCLARKKAKAFIIKESI